MENYMDNSFVITHNTIIAYIDQHSAVKVPGRFADIAISKIGDGSFMESCKLERIGLPSGITSIGRKAFSGCSSLKSVSVFGDLSEVGASAFSNCPNLSDVTIYDLPLSASEYYRLKSTTNRSNGEIYVSREFPQDKLIQKIVTSISGATPAVQIPSDISSLFCMAEFHEPKGGSSLDKDIPIIGFTVPSVPVSEHTAFCNHIKRAGAEIHDRKSEEKNDWCVRVGKVPLGKRTIIFTFDDAKTKEINGKFLISATLRIGCFFWQSAQAVMCQMKKYYIYRRYYLDSDPEMKYIRRDIAVYTDEGLVEDREEAQIVYGKYKLLSIL